MKISSVRFRTIAAAALTALGGLAASCGGSHPADAAYAPPSWQNSAVIYCVNPDIYSSSSDRLKDINNDLPRLQALGVNVLWLMPFQPIGQSGTYAGQYRTSVNSRYCMSNLEGFGANMGTSSDLSTLIANAHKDGMHVIMDVALNQTSWDNPLIESNPQYYYHSDGNVNNVNSIENGFPNGFNDTDIAGVDILNNTYGAQTYMTGVCQYWLNFGMDGFRFDSADSPQGSSRDFIQSYAQSLYSQLNPNNTLMWLGEEESPQIDESPYTLDYDWNIGFYANSSVTNNGNFLLQNTAKNGSGFSSVSAQYTRDVPGGSNGYPSGTQHMNELMDWDSDEDYNLCGGFPQTLDAAMFDLTIPGVPLIYNGEEVGNDQGGDNTHTAIDFSSSYKNQFNTFYTAMINLRDANPALQQGAITFESNSNGSSNVATYDRSQSGASEFYVEINFSSSTQTGTCTVPSGSGTWTDVSPSSSPGGTSHVLPGTGSYSLAPYDYAVFKRGAATIPATPTGVAAAPGNARITLTWNAVSGATSYNVYRSTTSGGETAYNTGITTNSFIDTSVTNGTKYYYKVAAVNSAGTSGQSSEVSATPSSSGASGSLTGSVAGFSGNVNLTTLGTSDWSAYGYGSGYEHKSGGGAISNVSAVGGSLNTFAASVSYTWTNGSPDASETNANCGYYNQGGNGDGFQLTVPASTTSQKLVVYVGGYNSGGTLTATLSDGSAATYTDASQSSSGNSYFAAYTLTFNAASAGQTLTLKWLQNNGGTNVTLYAAYLTGGSGGGGSAPATPTGVTATGGSGKVTVNWSAVSGAASYNVYRSTTSGGEGTTPYNSGLTTNSFVDTGVTAGTTYYYKVAAVNSSGTSAQSSEVHAAPTAQGSLSGSVTGFSGTVNLTSIGTTDWAAYGYGSGYEHKSGGGTVSNVSAVGGSLNTFSAGVNFTWTNGSPDASESGANCGYYNQGGNGDGFQFTAPASTAVQHLTVYLGGYNSGGTLTATLSDGSASTYTDSSQSSGGSFYSAYTLTFNAASAGQTLTVKWLQNNGGTNVTLYGAALH